ncbi:sensor histidine kinase [Reichenbachiella carrageenanivorans]|uniref:histidine kinase n=1 Tax=Reichenbachiella carrageenanivorans TaxID=2979869 RepID=A0ABY6CZ62_9BACT|nr:sensor histidine kinase [Reichenbachiella carrageenanivorans]UXX79202.1 sensor histidine kinase [Reichenbachiella carrageenanivorans]
MKYIFQVVQRLFLLVVFLFLIGPQSYGNHDYDSLFQVIDSQPTWEAKLPLYDTLDVWIYPEKLDLYQQCLSRAIQNTKAEQQYDFAAKYAIRLAKTYYSEVFIPDSAFAIINRTLHWDDQLSPSTRGALLIQRGNIYEYINEYDSSLREYNNAAHVYETLNDSTQREFGEAYLYMAARHMQKGDFIKSGELLENARAIFAHNYDTVSLIKTINETAILYGMNGFAEKAIEQRKKLIQLSNANTEIGLILVNYINYATEARKLNNDSLGIRLLKKAISLGDPKPDLRYSAYSKLTVAYTKINRCDSANHYFQRMQAERDKFKGSKWLDELYLWAQVYSLYCQNRYDETIALSKQLIDQCRTQNKYEEVMEMENLTYKCYLAKGDFENAHIHLQSSIHIKDSILSASKSNALVYMETLYEKEHRERQISDQENEIKVLATANLFKTRLSWAIGIGLLLFFAGIYFYRSSRFAIQAKKMEALYSRQLIVAHEDERKRISQDLHDSVGQSLILIKNKVALNQDENTTNMVSKALEEVRSISKALHPAVLENLGLTAAIQKLVSDADEYSDIFFSEEIDTIDGLFDEAKELQIYRIIQESLNNVLKHAKSESASVVVKDEPRRVSIQIKDYGVGFDLTEDSGVVTSLGMKTLRERTQLLGGKLMIESVKGKGTTVTLHVSKPNKNA